ncbi:hypothetical protein M5362_24735 [Streptomyces sp. Je 1-79]|uniref:hypothetical protein n=1 Tax=Streptomyces sp. Je 1-79 TaxID=2943847 RepID=UPI0021A412EB|nr:hypothetical protein [Streptomyces sp. Je 1-79]MCT4356339.1 hypothetical protein [Streptomyces sp. Je 1-79]
MATGTARRRGIRLAATLAVVVLALTGFQTSSGGKGGSGKSRSSGSDGGGCSSSKKKNNDYDHDDYDGGGSGGSDYTTAPATPSVSASPTSTVHVSVVDCVKPAQKKRKGKPARKADTTATLRITSIEDFTETFKVEVAFEGSGGVEVDEAVKTVTVESGETKTFEVAMESPKAVGRVTSCAIASVSVQ